MIYKFDDFTLDIERVELCQNGEAVRIEPQVFDLLELLITSNGRMVSRDEIFSAIWGDRIVSDAALSSRIKDARKALGDDGQSQKYIKTIHRRGLQFLGKVSETGAPVPEPLMALPDLQGKPSIGVLPFTAIGADTEASYIASGLTEDIMANLARFRGLMVFSRATTTALSESQSIVSELHDRFGVDLVLQGNLQRSASQLRVRVQLIDARTEVTLLSEQFDHPYAPESQFEIQDEIAGLVAARVGDLYGPTGDVVKRLQREGRPKSWSTVVWLARFHDYMTVRDPVLFAEVSKGLEEALVDDPGSSDGWAALARMRIEEYRLPFHYPPKLSLRDDALEYARKAVQLDGNNDAALTALALAHFQKYEKDEFEAAAKRAILLNPNNAITLAEIAMCYCLMSDFDRAVPLARRAIELSPVHPGWFRMPIACGLFMQGDARAALLEQLETPLAGYFWYHAHLAAYYAELGQMDKAREEVATTLQFYPLFDERIHTEGYVLCVGKPFFDRMAGAWREAGFNIPSEPYESGFDQA